MCTVEHIPIWGDLRALYYIILSPFRLYNFCLVGVLCVAFFLLISASKKAKKVKSIKDFIQQYHPTLWKLLARINYEGILTSCTALEVLFANGRIDHRFHSQPPICLPSQQSFYWWASSGAIIISVDKKNKWRQKQQPTNRTCLGVCHANHSGFSGSGSSTSSSYSAMFWTGSGKEVSWQCHRQFSQNVC